MSAGEQACNEMLTLLTSTTNAVRIQLRIER